MTTPINQSTLVKCNTSLNFSISSPKKNIITIQTSWKLLIIIPSLKIIIVMTRKIVLFHAPFHISLYFYRKSYNQDLLKNKQQTLSQM